MGAWIEIRIADKTLIICLSHPTWVRGLKLTAPIQQLHQKQVAPHMGAWIEILS